MLRALGEIAIVNLVFTYGKFPVLEGYVMSLLSSHIVNSDVFQTMVKLFICVSPLALDLGAVLMDPTISLVLCLSKKGETN
jgi:hypothetical protein